MFKEMFLTAEKKNSTHLYTDPHSHGHRSEKRLCKDQEIGQNPAKLMIVNTSGKICYYSRSLCLPQAMVKTTAFRIGKHSLLTRLCHDDDALPGVQTI